MLDDVTHGPRVELASEQPFRLGPLLVTPALLQVEKDGASQTLEPRVMQVLVVLARAEGRVVSRQELVERCWDGRIVGENAIQRVISRIRTLATGLGGFELETITKVGYRLRIDATEAQSAVPSAADRSFPEADTGTAPPPGRFDRRFLFGGAALLAGVGVLFGWQAIGADEPNAKAAKELVGRGRDALSSGLNEQLGQAVAYLKRATELDPDSSEAWGALALAYQHQLDSSEGPPQQAFADWTRSAARRALALEPGNVEAKVAEATIPTNFRAWAKNERVLRDLLAQSGSQQALETALGWLLCDTGRWREANACFRRALAFDPFHPANQLILSWGVWGSGNLEEADKRLANALKLWPQHRMIWQTRFDFLATTGRPEAALAMVTDDQGHPIVAPGDDPVPYETLRQVAIALDSGSTAEAVADEVVAAKGALGTIGTVTHLLALSHVDRAFDILDAFYFGSPERPAPGPLSRRKTSILFSAKGAPLRRHLRYPDFTRRLGLDDYWRETGTQPDLRP